VRANRLQHMTIVKNDHYGQPAFPPTADRLVARGPAAPLIADASRTSAGVRVRWIANGATSYGVYRLDGHDLVGRCDIADASHLVGSVRATRGTLQSFTDTTAVPGERYTYVVTALDRSHNESRSSAPRFTKA
jgi:fibronectin type 3 domain-containing protein